MTLSVNLGQINAAAGSNQQLREALTAIALKLQQYDAHLGTGPIAKVDAQTLKVSSAPPACGLSVAGANGTFTVSISLPQQATGNSKPQNAGNAPIYQEVSSSPVSDFSSGVTAYPLSTATSFVFPAPGKSLFWRLRSTYDQKTYNSFSTFGVVSAGLQTSAATQSNLSLNQSNFSTIDSVGAGSTATVRIYGSAGPGTAWSSITGQNSKVIPGGTITNITYGSNSFVAWDGSKYRVVPSLSQTFTDSWVPVGRVSVVSSGAGLVLPTYKAVVQSGAIVAIQTLTNGSGMTSVPTITITDTSGTGATAVASLSGGSSNGITVTNAGSGYTSNPTITASGGVAAGVGGGGGVAGSNSGRLYSVVANGS